MYIILSYYQVNEGEV